MKTDILGKVGIDYEKGVYRFMDDASLYESSLEMFLEDPTFSALETAMSHHHYSALFEAAHSLKGVAGNLDMTVLYTFCRTLTEYLLATPSPQEDEVAPLYNQVSESYHRVIRGIRAAMENVK